MLLAGQNSIERLLNVGPLPTVVQRCEQRAMSIAIRDIQPSDTNHTDPGTIAKIGPDAGKCPVQVRSRVDDDAAVQRKAIRAVMVSFARMMVSSQSRCSMPPGPVVHLANASLGGAAQSIRERIQARSAKQLCRHATRNRPCAPAQEGLGAQDGSAEDPLLVP
jgi:hypothetical protein